MRAYSSLAAPSVDTLVALDRLLRRAVPCCFGRHVRRQSEGVTWRPEWARVGVERNIWDSDVVEYNGRLLWQAHQLDPWRWRAETLYAATYPRDGTDVTETAWGVPDRDTLELYLLDYPHGPHAVDAARLLAFLYSDLSEVLRIAPAKQDQGYMAKAECLKAYIRPDRARLVQYRSALSSARRAFAIWKQLAPDDPIARQGFRPTHGSAWHFCPD